MKYFYPEKPVLVNITRPEGISMINTMSENSNYIIEKKYNGSRLGLFYLNGKFEFWNRHGEELKYRPDSDMVKSLRDFSEKLSMEVSGGCLFDGELRHNKVKGIRNKIILYDVFVWDNEVLAGIPFRDRRRLLERLLPVEGEPIGITEQYNSDFVNKFNKFIVDPEIEGIVIKRMNGMLNISRTRNQDSGWMYKARRPSNSYRF